MNKYEQRRKEIRSRKNFDAKLRHHEIALMNALPYLAGGAILLIAGIFYALS